ncbi:hypothetical protein PC116_g18195 [Phytophthora cactorum]|uniref:Uncharacterized protein n=1 Tax=Phytophthora cactorum TaxID=29920 RepID=A0A8T1CTL0_9STRA|nr:hypothetical protein Pcac1_g10814 [Phytophthora cactorum]KAG2895893.1 hypothetical protein PC114_g15343 [Phytophthora cactorum]KAG2926575.1 hypothetical protein PC117_g14834 [Phytophthora cactorum]KAG3006064.1 hypothetical protein PC119_g15075 [Phytophthora cactorum]KAG3012945.1 hypothetical protein PC120_g13578 [Phytophthora cactorum]
MLVDTGISLQLQRISALVSAYSHLTHRALPTQLTAGPLLERGTALFLLKMAAL